MEQKIGVVPDCENNLALVNAMQADVRLHTTLDFPESPAGWRKRARHKL
ncbi:MAG: hypothetical protein PUG00_10915 [Clostridiales bacterium]|nr:hypothetical protein [Clostridiales bacterium]